MSFPLAINNPPKNKSYPVAKRGSVSRVGVIARRQGPAIMRRAMEIGKDVAGSTVGYVACQKITTKICAALSKDKPESIFATNKGRALVGFGVTVAFDATLGRKIPGGFGKSITAGMGTYVGVQAAQSIDALNGYMGDDAPLRYVDAA